MKNKTLQYNTCSMARSWRMVCNTLCIAVVLCTFNACRTSKRAEEAALQKQLQQAERVQSLSRPAEGMTDLTAKIGLDLDYNSRPVSVKGRLRMRYNEVIQLNFTAFGLMEIASLEVRPDVVYIIDKVNKKYVKASYNSDMLSKAGINFSTIQALFWNRLFVPGTQSEVDVRDAFLMYQSGTQQVLRPKQQGWVKHHFYTDEDLMRLEQTQMSISFYEATWRYDMFDDIDGYMVPTSHDISLSGGSAALGAHITLSGVSCSDKSWKVETDLSRYQQVDIEDLLSVLGSLR